MRHLNETCDLEPFLTVLGPILYDLQTDFTDCQKPDLRLSKSITTRIITTVFRIRGGKADTADPILNAHIPTFTP